MVPILSLLLILGTSLIVTRVASVALEHTGLSRDAARFQARSAFTGVGFTTTEAEDVVGHPVRRSIVMTLMLVGNVGIVSAMAAVMLSALDLQTQQGVGILLLLLVGGVLTIVAFGSSRWVDRLMCQAIRWAIRRWTRLDAQDYTRLLHLRGEYGVSRFRIDESSWIAGKTLAATRLTEEGLLVLGIECPGGNFIGAPPADVEMCVGDEVVIYGPSERVAELDSRRADEEGEEAHASAATERIELMRGERRAARR
jgi:hypothetical protein